MEQMGVKKRLWGLILPVAVSVGLLFFLYRDVGIITLAEEVRNANLFWVAAYILLSTIEPLVRGLRWSLLLALRSKSHAVKGLYIAKAGNNILPLRIGDAVRTQYLRDKADVPYPRAIASIFAESALDLAVLGLIVLLFAFFEASEKGFMLAAVLLVVAPALLFVLWRALGAGSRKTDRSGLFHAVRAVLGHLGSFLHSRRKTPVLLYTLLLWILTFGASFCGLRMFLPSVSLLGALTAIVFVYFSILVPSAPGFIGTYHAAIAGSLVVMGYDLSGFPAVPIAVHLLQFIPQTALGLLIGVGYLFSNNWKEALNAMNRSRKRLFGRELVP